MHRTAVIVSVILAIFVLLSPGAHAQLAGTLKDVVDPAGGNGRVDWTTGVITAVGIGAPPAQPVNPAQARGMAERAAQAVAYRNLLEAVKGVRVDSSTTVENFVVAGDSIRTQVNGIIQGAMIMDKKYMSDGSVEVTVGMKLTGALADAVFQKQAQGGIVPGSAGAGQAYTGLIVDARGLGLRPAIAPRILDEGGREVYGPAHVNRDWAVREGMAGYLKDLEAAKANPRVTDKPLILNAIRVSGDARVDAVISNSDAAALQNGSQSLNMLEKCRVIILVD